MESLLPNRTPVHISRILKCTVICPCLINSCLPKQTFVGRPNCETSEKRVCTGSKQKSRVFSICELPIKLFLTYSVHASNLTQGNSLVLHCTLILLCITLQHHSLPGLIYSDFFDRSCNFLQCRYLTCCKE